MLEPVFRKKFRKDLHRMIQRGKSEKKIKTVILKLVNQEPLPPKYHDHKLSGVLAEFRDCHIEPDWILLYKINDNQLILARTGTHADLFE